MSDKTMGVNRAVKWINWAVKWMSDNTMG
jgi:hypothetical protein